MNELFEQLQHDLQHGTPTAAIDRLCTALREKKDYAALFYALLLKKRHELGVSPVPSGATQDLPTALHEPYENAIREAGRLVGRLYLEQGDIPRAWVYFRMLGEPEPVAEALEKVRPGEDEDVQSLVEIGYHHGVNPRRGFDLLLERFGICSAITTLGGGEFPHGSEVRAYCIHRLVHALYDELYSRLAGEIERTEGKPPAEKTVRGILDSGRDDLFADDFYHIDVSHLSSVVQMSMHLSPGPELDLARELCAYGKRLSPRFQYAGDPPFENQYHDYAVYLDVLAGVNVEEGLAHFRTKLENADPQEVGTAPAEVLVNLLLRVNRPGDAVAVARRHLAGADSRMLSCPGLSELCQRAGDYRTLAEVAREQGDAVHFLAGLLAERKAV
jgi:hypothetical protein